MFDVFISYSRADQADVETIKRLLAHQGVATFFDRDQLTPGAMWPQALEEALASSRAVAVFIGESGLGEWQKREMYFALERQVERQRSGQPFPVIPVLLPHSEIVPGFLFLNTWIDLRQDIRDAAAIGALLQAIHGAPGAGRRPVLDVCPYLGLRAFREEDAALFFGRAAATEAVLERLERQSVACIVAPSGLGKSSVLLAGVVPALRRSRPPKPTWSVATFTPRRNSWFGLAQALMPLLEPELSEGERIKESLGLSTTLASSPDALHRAIDRILEKSRGTDRLLLGIDQFEELFTLATESRGDSQDPAGRFIESLLSASLTVPLTVVATMRADYYGVALASSRQFADVLNTAQVALGPLTREELRLTIEQPAALVGLEFEAGLVDVIVDDVFEQPGGLPLLEYALTALWQKRRDGVLSHDEYKKSGGVRKAISERAESIYTKLGPVEQRAARRLFGRLVHVTRPDEEGTDSRKRATRQEVGNEAWTVAQRYALPEHRLLVVGAATFDAAVPAVPTVATGAETPAEPAHKPRATVEVAHEAIIRNWDTLRGWLKDDREFLLWRQRIEVQLPHWRATGALLARESVPEATTWLKGHRADLSDDELRFVDASVRAFRGRNRMGWLAAAAAVLAVAALATVELSRSHLHVEFGAEDRVLVRRGISALSFLPYFGTRPVADTGLVRADVLDQSVLGRSFSSSPAERADFLTQPDVLDMLRDTPAPLLLRFAAIPDPAAAPDAVVAVLTKVLNYDPPFGEYRPESDHRALIRFIVQEPDGVLRVTRLIELGNVPNRTAIQSLVDAAKLNDRLTAPVAQVFVSMLAKPEQAVYAVPALVELVAHSPTLGPRVMAALLDTHKSTRASKTGSEGKLAVWMATLAEAIMEVADRVRDARADILAANLQDSLVSWASNFGGMPNPLGRLIALDPAVLVSSVSVGDSRTGIRKTRLVDHLVDIVRQRPHGADPSDVEESAAIALGHATTVSGELRAAISQALMAGLQRPTSSLNTGAEGVALVRMVAADAAGARDLLTQLGRALSNKDLSKEDSSTRYRVVQAVGAIGAQHKELADTALAMLQPLLAEDGAFGAVDALAGVVPIASSLPEPLVERAIERYAAQLDDGGLTIAMVLRGGSAIARRAAASVVERLSRGDKADSFHNEVTAADTAAAIVRVEPETCATIVAGLAGHLGRGDIPTVLAAAGRTNEQCARKVVQTLLNAAESQKGAERRTLEMHALNSMTTVDGWLMETEVWRRFVDRPDPELHREAQSLVTQLILRSASHAAQPAQYLLDQLLGRSTVLDHGPTATISAYYRDAAAEAAAQWIVSGPGNQAHAREALREDLTRLTRSADGILVRVAAIRTVSLMWNAMYEQLRKAGQANQ